jgi:hypothetical protein
MLNTDEKMERKSTGRAGQEQRLEYMLNTDEKIERKSIGEQDMSREWKIC